MTRRLTVAATTVALLGVGTAVAVATTGNAGDPTLTVTLNDSFAGGSYDQVFERAYAENTPEGTPVYIYVPEGAVGDPSVDSMNPAFDHNPGDGIDPCADNVASDYLITEDQIEYLGHELASHIVATDEAHFGEAGNPDGSTDPAPIVMLVYNVQDDSYYDCSVTSYTAGYFAPEYIDEAGLNVIVVDAYDWANRIGDDAAAPNLYEGVVAHELEHLLMNYSDSGEISWVDEGLADMGIFLNGYEVGGSHLTYHQVFHRETSLIRWGGGLENYGASLSYFLYLWEQAGGNGDGTYDADTQYDGAGGDLLIKKIFQNQADSLEGVQAAIDEFNAETGADLRSATELFKDWAITVKLDAEGSDTWDLQNVDFGTADSGGWTIDIANDEFWGDRGLYQGRNPEPKWRKDTVPPQSALPFGVSYETFRNPGPVINVDFEGNPVEQVAPHTGDRHWWGGSTSLTDSILGVDSASIGDGAVVDFWAWYFIEDGWDYGYLEALVGSDWVTVPLFRDGVEVTTDTNPHDNNTEGNGLTGTSGGAYFVDPPQYVNLQSAPLPAGTTDVRFRYSTDAAYVDTGFFVDDSVTVDGVSATLSSSEGWLFTTGTQDNVWVVQVLAPCDLTPGTTSAGELVDNLGNHVYRFEGDSIDGYNLSTSCLTKKQAVTVVISNMTSGDIQVLDAGYLFRLTGTGNGNA